MKKLLLTLTCVTLITGAAFAQTATISFTDNGLYGGTTTSGSFASTDTFIVSLFGSMSGMPSGFSFTGFSLWMEAPIANSFNTAISLTGMTAFQFSDKNQPLYPKFFTDTVGADSGFRSDQESTR